jgi:hypothetical protein
MAASCLVSVASTDPSRGEGGRDPSGPSDPKMVLSRDGKQETRPLDGFSRADPCSQLCMQLSLNWVLGLEIRGVKVARPIPCVCSKSQQVARTRPGDESLISVRFYEKT